jgi:hypothetical protein
MLHFIAMEQCMAAEKEKNRSCKSVYLRIWMLPPRRGKRETQGLNERDYKNEENKNSLSVGVRVDDWDVQAFKNWRQKDWKKISLFFITDCISKWSQYNV